MSGFFCFRQLVKTKKDAASHVPTYYSCLLVLIRGLKTTVNSRTKINTLSLLNRIRHRILVLHVLLLSSSMDSMLAQMSTQPYISSLPS